MKKKFYNTLKEKLNEDKNTYVITIINSKEDTILLNKILKINEELVFENQSTKEEYEEIIKKIDSFEIEKILKVNENTEIFIENIVSRPQLIICGGGHIALSLCDIGKILDFNVTVIDNREEFANKERFPLADNIICNEFENALKNINYNNSYFVIVTRGHKDDKKSLKSILKNNFKYVGMIGSRSKVASVIKQLMEEGFTNDDIEKVHTPIGLKIGAQTPAEISISIAGEIISVKNSTKKSNIDDEILNNIQEKNMKMMLTTILDKNGSSPRGIGAKMLVLEDGSFVGTIGGGSVENAAYTKALELIKLEKSSIEIYDLSNSNAAKLGMACGGQIKVLFEYIN